MPSEYNGIETNSHPQWWRDRSLRLNVLWVIVTALTHVVAGYDAALMNSLQAVPMFYHSFPRLQDSNILGLTGALLFLPGLVVPFFAAWFSDRFGRKIPVIVSTIGLIVGAIIQVTSSTLGQFMAGRVVMGCFSSFGGLAGLALCAELSHPRYRGQATSMQVAVFYVGNIICAWTTYGAVVHHATSPWSWKWPTLGQLILPSILLPFLFCLPESPRFLVSRGRVEEARVTFAKQHANGDVNDPLVNLEVDEVIRAIELERSSAVGWSALWRTKGNRWRLFVVLHVACGAQLGGSGIVSYYLVPVLKMVGITSFLQQVLITGGLSIYNFVLATGGSLLVERVGRRPLWMVSTSVMLVSLIIVTALSASFIKAPSVAIGNATVAFLYFFFGGYDLAWSPLNSAYTVEVLSYSIRAKGLAVWTFATYVSLCFNTWVNPIALSRIGWKYYIVYIGVLVYLLTIIYFCFPETKGRTLEEVASVFDGGYIDDGGTRDRESDSTATDQGDEDEKRDKPVV